MLPTLSRLSVSIGPESRLRHRCSSQYLRISPLHWEFHSPLPNSSHPVPSAIPRLSPGLSRLTKMAAYAPFTPSNSDQCLHPPYYRSCWHGVSRCFFTKYHQIYGVLSHISCSLAKELYNPKAFFAHTASLRQAFAHCERFSTAASRRSLGSVSVPVLAVNLSIRLDVLALVGLSPTN